MSRKTKVDTDDTTRQEWGNDILLTMGHKRYKASIAYARALFQFAQGAGLLDPVINSFEDFMYVWKQVPALRKFLRCHAIDRGTRKARMREFFRNYIHVSIPCFIGKLIDNSHTDLVPGIYQAFYQIADEVRRQRRIRVITAFPMNDVQKKLLKEGLEKSLQLEVILRNEIDPEVLAGFVCYTDSIKIDMSLKRDFEKLKSHILSIPCEGDRKQ